MSEVITETPGEEVVSAKTPESTPAAESEVTLLGGEEVKPESKVETPEEKAAVEAETKRLLEAKDEDLTPEDLAKKQELVKAQKEATDKTVPEKYEVKVEGFDVDATLLDALTPVFKKHNLSQAAVQELAESYAPVVKAQMEASDKAKLDAWKAEIEGWKTESTKMLGAEAPKELAFAARFIDKFGGPKLRELLNDTGLGNHPEAVKAFIKAGKAISEDAFVDPNNLSTKGAVDLYDHPTSQATLK